MGIIDFFRKERENNTLYGNIEFSDDNVERLTTENNDTETFKRLIISRELFGGAGA